MYRRTPILFRIADSFFRHQFLFWSALLIVSLLTMSALYLRSKTFHATAMTQVQVDNVQSVLGTADSNTWVTPAQKNVDRFSEMTKQNQQGGFLDVALRKAHLVIPINVDPQADDPRYAMLQKSLSAIPESANQFSINLTWDNQQECTSIVNALQEQYINEVGLDRSSQSIASVHFLDSQIAKIAGQMRVSEKALADFKATFNGQLSDAESTYNNQLSSLTAELDEKQITLGENGRKRVILEQQLAQMKPMSILETSISDQTPLQREVADLLAKRAAMLATGKTPQHPDVVTLDASIADLQKQQRSNANSPENKHNTQTKMQENPLFQQLKQQIAEASIAQEADQQEMQNLRQQIDKYQKLVNMIPAAQRQLADKTREYSSLQEFYQGLEKQRQDVQTKADLDRLTATNSLEPIGVTFALPTTGRTKLIAMLLGSLILGCLVGAILVVLSEWSDHSLRHEADAERLLGVPVLAALPETADLRVSATRKSLSGGKPPVLSAPASEG